MEIFKSGDALVREAEQEDIAEIAKNVRQSDIDELQALNSLTPEYALKTSYDNSTLCWTVELAGKAVAMFGVVPITDKEGRVWLLATNDFVKLSKKFLRRSKIFIKIMLENYSHLENYVDCRNIPSIKWLSFCGAKFRPPEPYGVENKMFQYFQFNG